MSRSTHEQYGISHSQFRDHTIIHQGNVQGNVYYNNLPHRSARPETVRVIPYPRNEDLVRREYLIDKLDELLPQIRGSHAALWGLGGSGHRLTNIPSKTQIALDYAYRRCDADDKCCVFWVHADNQATFAADYKSIGKKLQVNQRLDGSDLLNAVRDEIEAQSKWVMVLDNADDLRLFGVGQQTKEDGMTDSLYKYVPHAPQGTVLWTSRDARIAGTLVGSPRGIAVRSMALEEAETLLGIARGESGALGEADVDTLLEELQYLPLAVSQAGLYMRRMSMSAEQYLARLRQGRTRWEMLKISDTDRHRRPEVSNSVLETWRISIERIRTESEMSYRMLHVVAYVDNQDIPHEMLLATAKQLNDGDGNSTGRATELDILGDVARLEELSFLSLRRSEDGERSYEMHKLVQEAVRYGLRIRSPSEANSDHALGADFQPAKDEAYYAGKALQVVGSLFPVSESSSWARCEQYVTHAIRVGEWAEVAGTELNTASLLWGVSRFLYDRGRWREKEPIDIRSWKLRRHVLGEKHPDTISSMSGLATTYHGLGRYNEAESIVSEGLKLRQEMLGERHPKTFSSMDGLGSIYYALGRYNEAEKIQHEALELQREVLGEKDPATLRTMCNLGSTYYALDRYNEAEKLHHEVLELQREVLGEKDPATLWTMCNLGSIYYMLGRYNDAEEIEHKTLELQREVLGEKQPDTIRSIFNVAATHYRQGRYDKAEQLHQKALDLRRLVLGENHPDTIVSMTQLAEAQEALQQASCLVKSDQSSTVSLWKGMRRKTGAFRKSMFSRNQAP
ncbi:hypothetical protein FSARC_10780 [Fusarium sarcochroum]|uniref:NB-ARC domain-containing protein n=1 Tax=Fusarium sarcochroum TaxID=1208366 RepID=A0A8H4TK65_9HYPO|nr:hypothetical protein FSARC_10780 [Fusarium sarcochroum]